MADALEGAEEEVVEGPDVHLFFYVREGEFDVEIWVFPIKKRFETGRVGAFDGFSGDGRAEWVVDLVSGVDGELDGVFGVDVDVGEDAGGVVFDDAFAFEGAGVAFGLDEVRDERGGV